MKETKLGQIWEYLRTSYWFIPSLMVIAAILLSFATIRLDETVQYEVIETLGWTYTNDSNGARTILSTIAGSTITVATTAFSITIVALQLASSQFGPRLLRSFMQDRSNQFVLGTFISTFLYCLLVLRTVQGVEDGKFLPQLSVAFSILLAVLNLVVLIYFIHHAARSIQADNVVERVSHDVHARIEKLFPQKLGQGKKTQHPQKDLPVDFNRLAYSIQAFGQGYMQAVDEEQLMKIARENNLLLLLLRRPGHFVVYKSDLVMVYPGEKVNQDLAKKINQAFVFGAQRTQQEDIEFAIEQLVEIAVRSLSPGINDPFTAIRCIDHLSAILCHLGRREIPSPYRYDHDDKLRIIADPVTFTGIADTAFNQIRQYGASAVAVMIRLLEAIAIVATHTYREPDIAALLHHAEMIRRSAKENISEQSDRTAVEQQFFLVQRIIQSQQPNF